MNAVVPDSPSWSAVQKGPASSIWLKPISSLYLRWHLRNRVHGTNDPGPALPGTPGKSQKDSKASVAVQALALPLRL